jgi:hypothetical protein
MRPNRVIRVSHAGDIVFSFGLPLARGTTIGSNVGYDLHTTQKGLYAPYDAKILGDYTGLTPPFDSDEDTGRGRLISLVECPPFNMAPGAAR